MGVYKLNLNEVDVQAKVVDNEELVKDGITELMGKLESSHLPAVGFDLKTSQQGYPKLLVLFVKDRCLLVQLGRMTDFPASLLSFLQRDQSICFLRLQDSRTLSLTWPHDRVFTIRSVLKPGVDIGTFAARALNNRQLEGCINLVELATKAGLPKQEQASQCREPDWGALCFTQEEVKYALKNAYECYRIGVKLLRAL